jgi:hypothetical protein
MFFVVNSGVGACLCLINTIAAKIYMSVVFRAPTALKVVGGKTKEVKASEDSPKLKFAHKTQMNEAEYSPLLFAGLLFLSVKGIDAPVASTYCYLGSMIFMWGRILIGGESKFHLPPTIVGASTRYIGLAMMCYEIWKVVA